MIKAKIGRSLDWELNEEFRCAQQSDNAITAIQRLVKIKELRTRCGFDVSRLRAVAHSSRDVSSRTYLWHVWALLQTAADFSSFVRGLEIMFELQICRELDDSDMVLLSDEELTVEEPVTFATCDGSGSENSEDGDCKVDFTCKSLLKDEIMAERMLVISSPSKRKTRSRTPTRLLKSRMKVTLGGTSTAILMQSTKDFPMEEVQFETAFVDSMLSSPAASRLRRRKIENQVLHKGKGVVDGFVHK